MHPFDMRFALSMLCFVSFSLCSLAASAEGRVALVIGNSDYDNVEVLPNAVNDARGVTRALRLLGFEVIEGYDVTQKQLLTLARHMSGEIDPDGVALFYFAGHGLQISGRNYMVPVDAFGINPQMVRESSVDLNTILFDIRNKAGQTIVILDACRENPFEVDAASRSVFGTQEGLAEVDAGVNSFIAFATEPGNVALDGEGSNSPFTSALLRHLGDPEADLHAVMRSVRRDVIAETDSTQVPWENSAMLDLVFLSKPYGKSNPQVVNQTPVIENETVYTYRVAGLNPQGDGFLALRSQSTGNSTMLTKMTEGTKLAFLGQNGVWFNVRTENGLEGWAHSNWIHFVGQQQNASQQPQDCDALWFARNEIFARNGYCFRSARGRSTFSNAGCLQGLSAAEIQLTPAERSLVETYVAREKALGC